MDRKIDFLIIGAPKAGTTSLHHYLRSHPDIYLPENKEMPFFLRDSVYSQGDRFLDLYYGDIADQLVVGMSHASMLFHRCVPDRAYAHNPDIKIVVALRNPVDRAYSAYWHARKDGCEDTESFEKALERETPGGTPHLPPTDRRAYLKRGHYYEHLQPFLDRFGRDKVHFILSEDLKNRGDDAVYALLKWFGADPSRYPALASARLYNQASMPRNMWLHRQLYSVDTVAKRIYHTFVPQRIRLHLNKAVTARLIQTNLRPFRYPPMQPETRARLVEYFAPYNKKLAELIGRNLDHWR